MYVRAGCPAFARPCVGIHKSTSLMSSSLLLQRCPACLVRLTWIVFVIGGRLPYSWCLVGCCCQDLFRIARSIDTGCCPEDLPKAMNDREEWQERVSDIRATSTIWWWWWNRNTIRATEHCNASQSRSKKNLNLNLLNSA